MDVSVVLPTYNEAENLPTIIPQIAQTLNNAGISGEIIVVDDNSPDGTADVSKRLGEKFAVQTILRTKERGLATAVIAGFSMSQAKVCVVMDADGSHPVETLSKMIRPILDGKADITVGSRYTKGGSPGLDWPWYRVLMSRFAGTLASGITRMTDPTTGYMGIRRELLQNLDLDPIGWKIVLEVVVKAGRKQLLEVPIVFHDRKAGKSKMNLRQQWNYVRHLAKLYWYRFV